MVRKSQLGLVLFLCGTVLGSAEAAEISVSAGVDVWSELQVSADDQAFTVDTNLGVSLDLEVLQPVSKSVLLGGGIGYLVPREIEDLDSDVSFLSGFAVVRFAPFGEVSRFSLLARGGYSIWKLSEGVGDYDEKGGLYLALGVGYDISEHLGIEVLAMRLSGEVEIEEPGERFSEDIDYDVLSLRVRYQF